MRSVRLAEAGFDLASGGGHGKIGAMKVSSVSPERWEMMEL